MTDKPVIFLLPGLLCDAAVWEDQRRALEPFYDVRIPVFRGFDSLRAMAQSVLDGAPRRFSVVGHSMGGRVAMELVHLAGNRIDHFAVMDTGVHPVQPGEAEKRQVLLDMAAERGLAAVAEQWLPPMVHPDRHQDAALMDSITAMILRNSIADFQGQITALLGRGDQRCYLPEISQRVLLVCAEADSWSPVEQHRQMQTTLPASDLIVVEGAGHMVTMEKPREVNRILLEWLERQ